MYTVLLYADNFRSIALYGLILFYDLTKDELAGRRPLAKFISIKLIVFFTFYQSLVVRSALSAPPVSLICFYQSLPPWRIALFMGRSFGQVLILLTV